MGLVFVVVELRQNNASLATANYWTLTQTSNEIWRSLAESEDLARLELQVRRGDSLTGIDSLRYAALVWMRLEQVWSAWDLYNAGVFSRFEWEGIMAPTRQRAAQDEFWAGVVEESPMPPALMAELLSLRSGEIR